MYYIMLIIVCDKNGIYHMMSFKIDLNLTMECHYTLL